ncbi:MAG: C39 family peptidase [Anaerolineae bacterium]|nr:C39 family peptidase [Anaerolineae bacterium]
MPQLSIPYRSQWAADAALNNSDCGPTCIAMILNHFGVALTPDGVYVHLPTKGPNDFTSCTELINVANAYQIMASYYRYGEQMEAFNSLHAFIDAGAPLIALVKYAPWKATTGNLYNGGHFVVVTGYDSGHIFMHDPLFGLWIKTPNKGAHYAMTNELFAAGWGGFPSDENPNWACIVFGKSGVPVRPAPMQPPAKPAPPPPMPAKPIPQPPQSPPTQPAPAQPPPPMQRPPIQPAQLTEDVKRRIRALAAYRWTTPPNFDDSGDTQLWLDNLGDWGLAYDTHVVQAGNTLVGLAARYYGEQHRWPAIKAYNKLQREGLWLGETILIPQLGESGAHVNPLLPSDTIFVLESMSLESVQPPLDYDALSSNSIGIGFVDG